MESVRQSVRRRR